MSIVKEFNDYRTRMNEVILAQDNLPLKRFLDPFVFLIQGEALNIGKL